MGMFTSGAYDAFQNRMQTHRKNRAGARKDYQSWLTSQREAGIDVTSEMATNQFSSIADNDMHINFGAPSKIEMDAQLKANNLVARDLRASNENSAFNVQETLNNRWEQSLEDAYLTTGDTATAHRQAAAKFENNPAMAEKFNTYLGGIKDPEAHKTSFLSGYMSSATAQSEITSLVDQGVTDYSTIHKNAPAYLVESFNSILERKNKEKMQGIATSTFKDFSGNNTNINSDELIATMKSQGVPQDIIDSFDGRTTTFNNNYFDGRAKEQITNLANNKTIPISPETKKSLLENLSDEQKIVLSSQIDDHNQTVETLADNVKSAKLQSSLTLNNENVSTILKNETLTPKQRIDGILATLGFDPTTDDVARTAVNDFVLNYMSSTDHTAAQAYEKQLVQSKSAAITASTKLRGESDKALNTKLESIYKTKDINPTQEQMLGAVITGLEPYYVDPNDVNVLGAVTRQVTADVMEGSYTPEEIINRAAALLKTDAGVAEVLQQQANVNNGPMPVRKFVQQWESAMEDFGSASQDVLDYADEALSIGVESVTSTGGVTDNGLKAKHIFPVAIRDLAHSIQAAEANIQELRGKATNSGLFSDFYRMEESREQLNKFLTGQRNYINSAKRKLEATKQKYALISEAIATTGGSGTGGTGGTGMPINPDVVSDQTGLQQSVAGISQRADDSSLLMSTADQIAGGGNGSLGTSPFQRAKDYLFTNVSQNQIANRDEMTKVGRFLRTDKAAKYLTNNPQSARLLESDPKAWYNAANQ